MSYFPALFFCIILTFFLHYIIDQFSKLLHKTSFGYMIYCFGYHVTEKFFHFDFFFF